MATLSIGEVAARSGFSASTLRYYEGVGVLAPPERSASGYRRYDEGVVARLAFIRRAKELGCTLEEISDLVRAWDGDDCAGVQHRLGELVATKIQAADERLRELLTLTGDLRRAKVHLDSPPAGGPCGDDCACLGPQPDGRRLVGPILGAPVACTLPLDEAPERLAAWQAVLTDVVDRAPIEGGLRLTLEPRADLAGIARLLVAEHGCCSFFRFALTVDDRGVALEVTAPGDTSELVTDLFDTMAA